MAVGGMKHKPQALAIKVKSSHSTSSFICIRSPCARHSRSPCLFKSSPRQLKVLKNTVFKCCTVQDCSRTKAYTTNSSLAAILAAPPLRISPQPWVGLIWIIVIHRSALEVLFARTVTFHLQSPRLVGMDGLFLIVCCILCLIQLFILSSCARTVQ
jgi:hypothetical protein